MMRKLLLIAVFVFLGMCSSYSQTDLKLGVNAGFPVGDSSSFTDFNWGADVAYLFNFIEIFEVGPMVGYSSFIGDGDLGDVQFIPVAASGRVDLPIFFLGLDLGYAVATQSGANGGVYYRPKVGYGMTFFNFIASYSGISVDGGNYSTVSLGIELSL